jgi:hypothetical protein
VATGRALQEHPCEQCREEDETALAAHGEPTNPVLIADALASVKLSQETPR